MNSEYLTLASEYDETLECCDLYGEYCYPCNSEAPDESQSSEEAAK